MWEVTGNRLGLLSSASAHPSHSDAFPASPHLPFLPAPHATPKLTCLLNFGIICTCLPLRCPTTKTSSMVLFPATELPGVAKPGKMATNSTSTGRGSWCRRTPRAPSTPPSQPSSSHRNEHVCCETRHRCSEASSAMSSSSLTCPSP